MRKTEALRAVLGGNTAHVDSADGPMGLHALVDTTPLARAVLVLVHGVPPRAGRCAAGVVVGNGDVPAARGRVVLVRTSLVAGRGAPPPRSKRATACRSLCVALDKGFPSRCAVDRPSTSKAHASLKSRAACSGTIAAAAISSRTTSRTRCSSISRSLVVGGGEAEQVGGPLKYLRLQLVPKAVRHPSRESLVCAEAVDLLARAPKGAGERRLAAAIERHRLGACDLECVRHGESQTYLTARCQA